MLGLHQVRMHRRTFLLGTSAVGESGPKAKDHLADVRGIEFVGPGENGFDNYRITL